MTRRPLDTARLVPIQRSEDLRGAFSTLWEKPPGDVGFGPESVHLSHNRRARTLRGLHFQKAPDAQAKLVHCVRGSAFDVVADLRSDSPTRGAWKSFSLRADSQEALWIPPGYAHGFLTLEANTVLLYLISGTYRPEAHGGIRWDDPRFAIEWPRSPLVMSKTDRNWPSFSA